MLMGCASKTEGRKVSQRRLDEGAAIWVFPKMAVSWRREPEATTLTLTIPACSVSRKSGTRRASRKSASQFSTSAGTRPP